MDASTNPTKESVASGDVRSRIVEAAARLIASGGPDAATTRAVAAAAHVQAPTIYRLFGDKRALLEAAAQHGLGTYVAGKAGREPHADPVQDLRDGWDLHLEFGLAHPGLFEIMASGRGRASPAAQAGLELLRCRIRRIALAGRLRVGEERALALLDAAGSGLIHFLLRQPKDMRDPGVSAFVRESVIAAITSQDHIEPAGSDPASAAALVRASLDRISVLSAGERHLLTELLDRIANAQG